MKVLRFLFRATLALTWVLCGLLTLVFVFPVAGHKGRLALKRDWSGVLLSLCGVRVSYSGVPLREGPALWVINHARAAVFIA